MTGARLRRAALVTGPLRHTPGRTLLAVLVIALGVALGLSVSLVNRSAADEVSLASRSLFGMADLVVEGARAGFDENLFPVLARLPEVALASPVVDVETRVLARGEPPRTMTVLGLDFFRALRMQPDIALEVPRTNLGALDDNSAFLSPAAARELGLVAGDEFELQSGMETIRFNVRGILPATAFRQRAVVLDIGTAQWRLQQTGVLQRVELRLRSGVSIDAVSRKIAALLPPGVTITTPGAAADESVRLTRAYRSNLTALALVALFTGAFLVHATQSLAVTRRRRELALLHALGVTAREQVASTLLGGALVGLAGAVTGVALGVLLARAGLQAFGADLGAGYFRGLTPALVLPRMEIVVFVLLGTAAAVLGSLQPALAAARIPVALALKAGDVEAASRTQAGMSPIGIAVLLWAVAGILLLSPPIDGLPLAGYGAIALILIGAICVMPAVLESILRLLPQTRVVPVQIAFAHLKGTARQATMSLSAILVSFSLMVAMAVMVTSFRLSLDQWLEKILPADLYLRIGFASETGYLNPTDLAGLQTLPGVREVMASRFTELSVAGAAPLALVARPIVEATADRTLWLEGRAAKPVPAGALPAWISQAAADLLALEPDAVFVAEIVGREVRLNVRGIYRDYERQGGAVTLDRELYMSLTGDERANAVWFWLVPGTDANVLAQSIRARFPQLAATDVREPREIRALTLRVFDRTFAVTYLLEAIAVCIGLAGIAASTSAQVLARRGELGMLRHVGLTRRQTGAMLGCEGALLGGIGVIAGLAVGTLVSLVLIYVVNRQSFHWSMDVYFPGMALFTLSVVLVAASAATAVWAGRLALKEDVVRAVREDW